MKKIVMLITMFLSIIAYSSGDDILGLWITEKSDSGNQIIVEMYKVDEKYYGKIKDLTIRKDEKGNNKLDTKNPKDELKTRELVGIDFVSNFTYDGEKYYEDGNIYDPTSGKTYYCYLYIQEDGSLFVKGSIDKLGLIGKKQIWVRY